MQILSTYNHTVMLKRRHTHKSLSSSIVTQALDVVRIGYVIDGHAIAVFTQRIIMMRKNLMWMGNEIEEPVNRPDSLPSLFGKRDNTVFD